MSRLDELGIKYDTDKSSKDHNFCDDYERILSGRDIKEIVEIGVFNGGSLRMWSEYYPEAKVYGLDNDPKYLFNEENIECSLINQRDTKQLFNYFVEKNPDLVIDDGSHMWYDQFITFVTVFPMMKSGSVYILEDIHTSFHDYFATKISPYMIFKYLGAFKAVKEMYWVENGMTQENVLGNRSLVLIRR